MGFEYDHEKSEANKAKHGIEAQALRDDPDLVEIPAKVTDELRTVVIGLIGAQWILSHAGGRANVANRRALP